MAEAAVQRLDRDVLALSGISAVIWLEGINDFSKNGNASLETVQAGMKDVVGRIRDQHPSALIATRLNASLRHRISSSLRLQYFAQVETVRGAANEASPLVRSKQDAGIGVSLLWGVWHSAESGAE